ncbi:MAG: AMP-binding protein [Eubacteriales bacterium]|nr:AMP-binding protein [Eubacteriales bacterium]MDD4285724.1 AMP-binding protein [Eubacteriales bacterium]NLV70267.1 AMP-binding protein [Clostridiales bacterium]
MNDRSMLYPAVEYNDIKQLMQATVDTYKDRIAFTLKHASEGKVTYESVTYGQFGLDIRALGTALIRRGYGEKRFAIIGKNSYPWITGYFAGLNSGMVTVPLDKGLPPEEIDSCLIRSRSDILLFDPEHSEYVKSLEKERKTGVSLLIAMEPCENYITFAELIAEGRNMIEQGDRIFDETEIRPDVMSLILFTSGTTSASKAVMLSHRNLASNIYALNCCEEVFPSDVNIAFLPFHHTFSSTGITFILSKGASNVFCDGLKYIAQNLKEYQVSVFICVPLIIEAMYKKIFQQAKKQGKDVLLRRMMKLSSALLKVGIDVRRKLFHSVLEQLGGKIRFVISGAAAISPEVAKGFNDLGILTIQGYGLTETAPVLTAENAKNIRIGSVGVPMCNVELKIHEPDESGIGEVIAKGPNVMLGYYENPEESEKVLRDGWFFTGDLGSIDKDGFLFLCGRKKNVIVLKNGKNVYPEELEILLNRLPYLEETMVFGWEKGNDYVISAKLVYREETVLESYPDMAVAQGLNKEKFQAMVQKDVDGINAVLPTYKHIKRLVLNDEPTVKTTTAKIKRFEEIRRMEDQIRRQ